MISLLSNIPFSRLKWYFIALGTLPILLAFWSLYSKVQTLNVIQNELLSVSEYALMKEKRQEINNAVISAFSGADRFYIDKQLESMTPLAQEVEILEKIAKQTNFTDNDLILQRLQTLKQKNRLVFAESNVQNFPRFTETQETLINPVEIDLNDLERILALVEGVEINGNSATDRPLLIISDLRLEKKESRPDSDTFLLNMKLIKREFN
ncbi:MAG: hypothetical protein KDK48_05260 [Chlamydiia bacterium]|nr:hypothetical protein [Chlamydiia bacterium]